jgi:hypothetical protein
MFSRIPFQLRSARATSGAARRCQIFSMLRLRASARATFGLTSPQRYPSIHATCAIASCAARQRGSTWALVAGPFRGVRMHRVGIELHLEFVAHLVASGARQRSLLWPIDHLLFERNVEARRAPGPKGLAQYRRGGRSEPCDAQSHCLPVRTTASRAKRQSRLRRRGECSFRGDPTLWWQWRAGFGRRPRRKPMI